MSVEIIVTDDDPDGSARDVVAKHTPFAIWNEGPSRGPAANRNSGARIAKGDLLIFLDDDCTPDRNWLPALLKCATDHPGVDVFEGRISAERRFRYAYECCPINETGGCLWSANIAIRRKCFWSLSGFDEDFPFAAMEDVDFQYRCQKSGKEIVFCPDAVVLHPVEIRSGSARFLRALYSFLVFVEKHPEETERIRGPLLNILRVFKHKTIDRSLIQPLTSYVSLVQELWSMAVLHFVLGDSGRMKEKKRLLAAKLSVSTVTAHQAEECVGCS
jgi:GT2 family glycosyltransferase